MSLARLAFEVSDKIRLEVAGWKRASNIEEIVPSLSGWGGEKKHKLSLCCYC